MDIRVIGLVKRFFRLDPATPRLRRKLLAHLEASLEILPDTAEALVIDLVDAEFLLEMTVWYYSSRSENIVSEAGVAMGPKLDSGVLPAAGAFAQ